MRYYDLKDNFLKKYNPSTLNDYIKLKWRESGKQDFMDISERIIFQVIRSGRLWLSINSHEHELIPGYGFVLDLADTHQIRVENWDQFDVSTIIYPYRVINKFYDTINPKEEYALSQVKNGVQKKGCKVVIRPRIMQITPKMEELITQIRNPLKNSIFGGATESLLSSKMLLLYLLRLNQQPGLMRYVIEEPRGNINESLKKRIKLVQEYIHHNYHKNINLYELSNIACISKNYFVSIFKESLGKTPMDYLAVIRLEKAKEFLLHTQKPVKRIAFDTGFSSVSSFSQFFTRMIGCSPKEYRENNDIITIVNQEKEENHEKV